METALQKIASKETLQAWLPTRSQSLTQNIQLRPTPIAVIRKLDLKISIAKVALIIESNIQRLNIDKNMTGQQIAYCAEDIVNSQDVEIYALGLDDIQLCMESGIRGHYGEIYNRMDQGVIFGWLKKYWNERSGIVARMREMENNSNVYDVLKTDAVYGVLKDVADKLRIKEVAKATDDFVRVKTKADELQEELILEFDTLNRLQKNEDNGVFRYVVVEGKKLTCDEYLKYRLMQMQSELEEENKNETIKSK